MTPLFIQLTVITLVLTGIAFPCFFRNKRFVVGCVLLSISVLTVGVICFITPVFECLKTIGRKEIIYFGSFFLGAVLVSSLSRFLVPPTVILSILYLTFFLLLLLSQCKPSLNIKDVKIDNTEYTFSGVIQSVSIPAKYMLPLPSIWYRYSSQVLIEDKRIDQLYKKLGFEIQTVPVNITVDGFPPFVVAICVQTKKGKPTVTVNKIF